DVHRAAVPGQHVGRRGADITAGADVVSSHTWLTPARVGSLAAIGCAEGEVFARPRIALLSTGDEGVEHGRPLPPGQICYVNRFTLGAIVDAHGGEPEPHQVVHDSVEELQRALDACLDADVVIFSGGSSVGNRDFILDLISARGEMVFHG